MNLTERALAALTRETIAYGLANVMRDQVTYHRHPPLSLTMQAHAWAMEVAAIEAAYGEGR